MTKVGILTFHNNENRGAILQAHCLQRTISKLGDNISAEIVDYRTTSKENNRMISTLMPPTPKSILRKYNDRKIVSNFLSTEAELSEISITTDNYKKSIEWLSDSDYDVLITGSDEVWKVKPEKRGKFLSKLSNRRPFPNAYFLHPSLSAQKVAYAASANRTDLDQLTGNQIEIIKENVSAYDCIGVRDSHTQDMLKLLNVSDVQKVPDPTILMNIPTCDVTEKLEDEGINLDRPILGFHAPDNELFEEITNWFKRNDYQIVSPTTSGLSDVNLEGKLSPLEYYSLYEQFDTVITNSLHSSIFSIKTHTPFSTIDVGNKYAKLESKTQSLLSDFELEERHVDAAGSNKPPTGNELSNLCEQACKDLDGAKVNRKLEEQKARGINYLNESIVSNERVI